MLLVERADEVIVLLVRPLDGESIGLFLSSRAPRCRFPEKVFELPLQVNGTGFQLKHAIRTEQRRDGNGSCTEAIATSYHPQHYWPLKTATAVREAAEVLLPAFANRPPDEGFPFFAMLGMSRRVTGDLAFAASSFDVAIMLATMTIDAPNVGVVYDNLATVRRLQKRWPEAEQASDRAIAALETVDDPQARQALAGVYNNRALILVDEEQYEPALAYSEKALAILKVTLKNQSKELEPFME